MKNTAFGVYDGKILTFIFTKKFAPMKNLKLFFNKILKKITDSLFIRDKTI